MKKILISLSLLLTLGFTASAAIPREGVYLDKEGSPITEKQMVPPSVKSAPMLPQSAAVHEALSQLPHAASTVLILSIDEDGVVTHEEIAESSSSLILDQYAAGSAKSWTFHPARRGDKDIPLTVRIPVRFTSALVSVPPAPEKQIMADMKEKEEQAAERSGHPSFTVKLSIDRNGKMSAPPVIEREGPALSGEDFKILSSYIERSLRQWTFAPARNPDGEAINAETVISITV